MIDDINRLQTHGLTVHGTSIKFSFSTLVADNLASHLIGGFQANFNGNFFCRRCFITQSEKSLPMDSVKVAVRTINNHDDLVRKISTDPLAAPIMGIIGLSPFDRLIGFHPIVSLPADVMHDCIEGVCPLILVRLLKQASGMRLMTYGKSCLFFPCDFRWKVSWWSAIDHLTRRQSTVPLQEQSDHIFGDRRTWPFQLIEDCVFERGEMRFSSCWDVRFHICSMNYRMAYVVREERLSALHQTSVHDRRSTDWHIRSSWVCASLCKTRISH